MLRWLVFLAIFVAICTNVAMSTDQTMDVIRWDCNSGHVFQSPLENLWKTRDMRPRFDIQNTANWKGYTASWEIRDEKLFLTGFVGAIDGKDATLEDIVHQPALPVFAKWFSGQIYVLIGEPLLGESRTIVDAVFPKVVVFDVQSGTIRSCEEKKNYQLPKPPGLDYRSPKVLKPSGADAVTDANN